MSSGECLVNSKLNCLIVTANVGTLFEDPEGIQDGWMNEMIKVIEKHQPTFIVLHCQEIGGKDYKSSLDPVNEFFEKLFACKTLADFSIVRGFLDGDVEHVDQYTALGSFYLVHSSLKDVAIYDYEKEKFTTIDGKEIVSKGVASLPNIRKEKFEQDFFPDCKWSRKGYIRVRWKISGKVMEFVNIHLFHDDSNLVSIKSSPSPYTAYRKRALNFVMKRLREQHPIGDGVYFICGDFNFRLDVKALVQKLCPASQKQVVRAPADDEVIRVLYRHNAVNGSSDKDEKNGICDDEALVKIEKKVFQVEKSLLQPTSHYEQLRPFDREFKELTDQLKEFEVRFPPTYPFSENTSECKTYMKTRCPSWCDRILLSHSSWDWLQNNGDTAEVTYSTIGDKVCMGDHKPVYLAFNASLKDAEGRIASSKLSKDDGQTSSSEEANGKEHSPSAKIE